MRSVFMNSWYSINDIPRKTRSPVRYEWFTCKHMLSRQKMNSGRKKISVKLHIPLLNTAQWAKYARQFNDYVKSWNHLFIKKSSQLQVICGKNFKNVDFVFIIIKHMRYTFHKLYFFADSSHCCKLNSEKILLTSAKY